MSAPLEASGQESLAFDRGVAPILEIISLQQAKQLAEFQGDQWLRLRIDELASKCNEGELTAIERAEYEGYVRANKFVAILQAQTRKILGRSSGSK